MSSAPGMCQTYPAYTSGAPEDVSTALHGSGEGSLCTKVHAARGAPLYCIQTTPPMRRRTSLQPYTDQEKARCVPRCMRHVGDPHATTGRF